MRAFEYYCWNLLQGKVGGVTHTQTGGRFRRPMAMINQRTGKEISIKVSAFEDTKEQKKGWWS